MNDNLDTFQQQLLTRLRREVSEFPRQDPHSAERRSRRVTARRLSLAGVAAGAVASVAVSLGVVSLGGAGTTPAFAVTTAHNGDVVVTITGPADAHDLEAALKEHGLDVDVIYDDQHYLPSPEDRKGSLGGSYGGAMTDLGPDTEGARPAISWTRTDDGTVSVMRVHGSFAAESDRLHQHLTMLLNSIDGITIVLYGQCDDGTMPARFAREICPS